MPLSLAQKKAIVEEVTKTAEKAHSAVVAEYRGLTVKQQEQLRVQARKNGVYLRVVKNTLAQRAMEGTDFSCLNNSMRGPLILAFSMEDPGSAARVIRDFSKKNELLVVKQIAVDGQAMGAEALNQLASLPTRDEAISQLMSVMKAPIEKLARTLAEPYAMVVRTMSAVAGQKGSV